MNFVFDAGGDRNEEADSRVFLTMQITLKYCPVVSIYKLFLKDEFSGILSQIYVNIHIYIYTW